MIQHLGTEAVTYGLCYPELYAHSYAKMNYIF